VTGSLVAGDAGFRLRGGGTLISYSRVVKIGLTNETPRGR